MSQTDWRFIGAAILVGGLIAIDAHFAAWTPTTFVFEGSRIPETIGAWTGTKVELSENEVEQLLGDGRLTYDRRKYASDGDQTIDAWAVYLERPEAIRHTPDRCLTVTGWAVDRVTTVDVPILGEGEPMVANLLTGTKGDRKIVQMYVFVTADGYRRTPLQTLLEYSSNRLSSKDQAMAMVMLVSIVPFEDDQQELETINTLVDFASQYLPHLRSTLSNSGAAAP